MILLFVELYSETPAQSVFFPHPCSPLFHFPHAELELLPESPTPAGGFPATLISTVLELKESFLLFRVCYHYIFFR